MKIKSKKLTQQKKRTNSSALHEKNKPDDDRGRDFSAVARVTKESLRQFRSVIREDVAKKKTEKLNKLNKLIAKKVERNGRKERAMGNESHESGIARVSIISSTDAKKGSGNARGRKKRTSLGVRKSSDENAGIPNDSTRATSARKTVDDDNKWVEYYRRKYLED
jgi:hypothetical protein